MTEAQAVMRAVVGRGWQTLGEIAARVDWLGERPSGAQIAPLCMMLADRRWLVFDGRDHWISARLARHLPPARQLAVAARRD